MNKNLNIFTNGIIKENPLLVLMIGLCSSLAVTTSVPNGLGMGRSFNERNNNQFVPETYSGLYTNPYFYCSHSFIYNNC